MKLRMKSMNCQMNTQNLLGKLHEIVQPDFDVANGVDGTQEDELVLLARKALDDVVAGAGEFHRVQIVEKTGQMWLNRCRIRGLTENLQQTRVRQKVKSRKHVTFLLQISGLETVLDKKQNDVFGLKRFSSSFTKTNSSHGFILPVMKIHSDKQAQIRIPAAQ